MFHNDMYGYVPRRNPLATASMVLGILSLLTCFVFYLSLPLGALAILLAILSRIERNMSGKGKAGIVCGLCGIIATLFLTISSVYFVMTDSTARSYLEYYMQLYTGDSDFDLEEELGDLLPYFFDSETDDSMNPFAAPDREETPEAPEDSDPSNQSDTPKKEGIFL